MNELRKRKMEEAIKGKIATMIVTEEIKDHRVGRDINVTHVKVSNDMTLAKVYVSSYKSVQYVDNAVEALNGASGFVRVALGKMLTSRNTPKPVFFADLGMREGFVLNERIKMVVTENQNMAEHEEE